MLYENKKIRYNSIQRRYFFVAVCFALFVIVILIQAINISFVEGDVWRKRGAALTKPNIEVLPTRGNIFASDGRLMATSETNYRLYIDFWADGLKKDTLMKYLEPLSVQLNKKFPERTSQQHRNHILKGWNMRIQETKLIASGKKVRKKSREYRLLDRELNYLELKEVRTMPFLKQNKNRSGLITKELRKRTKPFGTLASRTIGDIYGTYEKGGKNGLEMEYNDLLKGIPGTSTRRKINGRIINVIDVEPIHGKDIISTIDIDIQDITEKALLKKLKEIDAESGTSVIMEVATGEIKAITNMQRIGDGNWRETKNHAVADETEPGSTFKVASMMVALEDGMVKPSDIVETGNGIFFYAGTKMTDHNWNKGGYQNLSAEQVIWNSSNIGIAKIILRSYEDNPSKFIEGLHRMGLNIDLKLEIPGAGHPYIKSPKDKASQWSRTSLPWMTFGYELTIPPIYTLTFFNAIANKGKMLRPFFVKEIKYNLKTEETRKPEVVVEQICSPKTLEAIKSMLEGVVEYGTGKDVKSNYINIAGKTGTAQISQGSLGYRSGGRSHQVSFCGYFPAENPKYSCITVIRKPRFGVLSGGAMAGGVVKQIAEEVNARFFLQKPSDYPLQETRNPKTPTVKNGLADQTEFVLDKINLDYKKEGKQQWAKISTAKEIIILNNLSVKENIVPSVLGMGVKDAIYLLESSGLIVRLSGRGKVVSQSIDAGSKIVPGKIITIKLM
ncbi:penicillin-binding protein [Bacteroidales bacterium]|nr:penicillin-binding protein [Bacteroidales bacterium]